MGLYDEIEVDGRVGQVKLFLNCMTTYRKGDKADFPGNVSRYSIAMREGGYVHVIDYRIVTWRDAPLPDAPIFDKWGDYFVPDHPHESGVCDYLFSKGDDDD